MVSVVEKDCQFSPDMTQCVIVLESDAGTPGSFQAAFDELNDMSTKTKGLAYASKRLGGRAGINGNCVGPYAVNRHGQSLEKVRGPGDEPLPPAHPDMQPARYRLDVPARTLI